MTGNVQEHAAEWLRHVTHIVPTAVIGGAPVGAGYCT
jgi:hypothetical protein